MPAEEQVSFVGELSLATACAFSCNCNGIVGYEVMFLEGIVIAPDPYSNGNVIAGFATVDTSGAMIAHGVRAGVNIYW